MGFSLVWLIFYLLSVLVFWRTRAKFWIDSGAWWLIIFPPFAFILLVTAVACYFKNREDKLTLKRHLEIYSALSFIKRKYLNTSSVVMLAGAYGAWIEIYWNEGRGDYNTPVKSKQRGLRVVGKARKNVPTTKEISSFDSDRVSRLSPPKALSDYEDGIVDIDFPYAPKKVTNTNENFSTQKPKIGKSKKQKNF